MIPDHQQPWPILTHYDQAHLDRIALPLGGIGTGTVSLGGRGNLHDWEIVNRPAKGFTPPNCFFALYTRPAGRPAVARALEGILLQHYEGAIGSIAANHGLLRFRSCSFVAAYPFGQVLLVDPDVPLEVRIEVFNPLVPADLAASSIPVAILRFVLANPTDQPVTAAVCGSMQNFIGADGTNGHPNRNYNQFRRAAGVASIQGLALASAGVDPQAEQFGTFALATTAQAGVTYRSAWAQLSWGNSLLDFWDDFSDDGALEERAPGDEPAPVASLYNLSTLRSQTCFRTPDGRFWGWEGCHDQYGSCYGSCTHVWNYEQASAFLFGDMARSMREIEFRQATRDDGHMSFRVHLPLEHAQSWGLAAADGQMGCIMKLYRDWQLSGDDTFLRELWPRARAALEFCWIPGGWDADRDGVMEGCQHNTMDVEYYGPNPQMAFWYLGALRAAEEMARHLGEAAFAATCRDLFERGQRWIEQHLFNGEYYEQIA